jgi:hypothetical protein
MTTLHELAEKVLADRPEDTIEQWGRALRSAVRKHPERAKLNREVEGRLIATLGQYVKAVKADAEAKAQRERRLEQSKKTPKITYKGKVLAPTLSVRKPDGGRQLVLWVDVSPAVFVEAVNAQQNRIDGMNAANAVRIEVATKIRESEPLRSLATLREVCDQLGIDPDTLGLEELGA